MVLCALADCTLGLAVIGTLAVELGGGESRDGASARPGCALLTRSGGAGLGFGIGGGIGGEASNVGERRGKCGIHG